MKRLIKAILEAKKTLEQTDLKKEKSVKFKGMTIVVWKMEDDPTRGDIFTYTIDGDKVKDLDIGPRPFFPEVKGAVKIAKKEIEDQINRNLINKDQLQKIR